MASSIHIQKSAQGSIHHNSRENFSHSVVFRDDEKNEIWNNAKEAYEIYRFELRKRSENYTKRTGQKLQSRAVTQLSAVVNLEQRHTMEDLVKIKKYLEKEFDTKVYQMAIHRDEGKLKEKATGKYLVSGIDFFLNPENNRHYYDKKYTKPLEIEKFEIIKNYHAHIEMMGLKSCGKAIRQEMNRYKLSRLQDFVAETLQMERGKKYKTEKSPKKRLDTHEFKKAKKIENQANEAAIAKVKDLKAEIAAAREELRKNEAERKDYAKLEQLNKELKEKIKEKTLTVEVLNKRVNTFVKGIKPLLRNEQKKELREMRKGTETYQKATEMVQQNFSQLTKRLTESEKKLKNALESKKELEATISIHRDEKSDFGRKLSDFERKLREAEQKLNIAEQKLNVFKQKLIEKEQELKSKDEELEKIDQIVPKEKRTFFGTIFENIKSYAYSLQEKIKNQAQKIKSLEKENKDLKEREKELSESERCLFLYQEEDALQKRYLDIFSQQLQNEIFSIDRFSFWKKNTYPEFKERLFQEMCPELGHLDEELLLQKKESFFDELEKVLGNFGYRLIEAEKEKKQNHVQSQSRPSSFPRKRMKI